MDRNEVQKLTINHRLSGKKGDCLILGVIYLEFNQDFGEGSGIRVLPQSTINNAVREEKGFKELFIKTAKSLINKLEQE